MNSDGIVYDLNEIGQVIPKPFIKLVLSKVNVSEPLVESGRIFTIGPFGHGEADKIVISRDYVFCNCDAYNMGRYPRKFSSSRSFTEENPEVDLIFGTNDFRFS